MKLGLSVDYTEIETVLDSVVLPYRPPETKRRSFPTAPPCRSSAGCVRLGASVSRKPSRGETHAIMKVI